MSFNQQLYQPPTNQTSFGNENIFKAGNDDPFAGLEGKNTLNMGMGATNMNQSSNTQMNYNMNPSNQQTSNFDFNMGQGKKKDDFDLL